MNRNSRVRHAGTALLGTFIILGGQHIASQGSLPCPAMKPPANYTLATNANVTVVVDSDATPYGTNTTANQATVNGIYDGLGGQNYSDTSADGNGSGVIFTNADSTTATGTASSPVINVDICMCEDPSGQGNVAYMLPMLNSSNTVTGGTLFLYLGAQGCGGGTTCWNPNAPGFQDAVSTAVQHELTHFFGVSHPIDSPIELGENGETSEGFFIGQNNTGVNSNGQQVVQPGTSIPIPPEANGNTHCDKAQVKKSRNCPCNAGK